MPILSVFFGITIRIYFEDHDPPHIHVEYGEHRALVEIETGKVLAGRLPVRCKRLVGEWRAIRVAEIRAAWKAARASRNPRRIAPLD